MSWTGCEEIATWFTTRQSADPEFRGALRKLLSTDSPDLDAIAGLVGRDEPRLGALLTEEFRELPPPTTLTVLRAWRSAIDEGLQFQMISERPDAPIAFARRRLVRVVTDVDSSGVTVRLSHIPGRHPLPLAAAGAN